MKPLGEGRSRIWWDMKLSEVEKGEGRGESEEKIIKWVNIDDVRSSREGGKCSVGVAMYDEYNYRCKVCKD